MAKILKIGIVGCGTIGPILAKAVEKKFSSKAKVVAVCDIEKAKARQLAKKLKSSPSVTPLKKLIGKSDLVIEAASAAISFDVVKKSIQAGKDVMIMSVGGLLGRPALNSMASKKNCRLYIPSGAICGLDGLKGASPAGIKQVTLTTRKPPMALDGAPYILKKRINLKSIKKETVVFSGSAKEATKAFPKNINVAAILSLAGIGAAKTRVRIIADPRMKRNVHQVDVEGGFGRLSTRTENVPSPGNPKTSYLAALSAIATLEGIVGSVKIGT